jgi:hypothetical protein
VKRRILFLLPLGLVVSSVAAADAIDRVSFATGGAATSGYPAKTSLALQVPESYTRTTATRTSGSWSGPKYFSFPVASTSGTSRIDWHVSFAKAPAAQQAIDATLVHHWTPVDRHDTPVEHDAAGTPGTDLAGLVVATKNPATDSAQYETAVAVRVCRGVFAVADFEALDAASDAPPPPNVRYYVSGDSPTLPSVWNRDATVAAAERVLVDGYLPLSRIRAKARRRIVSGSVWDCAGGGMPHVRVKVGRRVVKTDVDGAFRVRVSKPGRYVAAVALAGVRKSARVVVR